MNKSIEVRPVLTKTDKREIVAMLNKAVPHEMALMRYEAARINFEYVHARTQLSLAEVEVARLERQAKGD